MRLVLIEWEDSYGCSARWQPVGVIQPERMVCRSVGWLAHDGPESKVVIPHMSDGTADAQKSGCGDMTIPTAAVLRMVTLKIPGKRAGKRKAG